MNAYILIWVIGFMVTVGIVCSAGISNKRKDLEIVCLSLVSIAFWPVIMGYLIFDVYRNK